MILMSMSDHEALYLFYIVFQISNIRNYQVYTQHIVLRKGQTAVNYNNTVFVLKGSNVHSNLLQSSKGNYLET